jgi:hypothetical protein
MLDGLLPEWAKDDVSLKLFGVAFGLVSEMVASAQLVAATAGLLALDTSPDDALPIAAKERGGLWRYPFETLAQYRQRLIAAAPAAEFSGSSYAITSQLAAAGYPGVTIVTHYDREGPRGEPAPYQSQFWLRFPTGSHPTPIAATWDTMSWGAFYWDDNALPRGFVELCMGIVNKFGDPSGVCRGIELEGY